MKNFGVIITYCVDGNYQKFMTMVQSENALSVIGMAYEQLRDKECGKTILITNYTVQDYSFMM